MKNKGDKEGKKQEKKKRRNETAPSALTKAANISSKNVE